LQLLSNSILLLYLLLYLVLGFICEEAYDGQAALQKYADMCAQGTPPEVKLYFYILFTHQLLQNPFVPNILTPL
jgi:uncharacterized membrane protein YozB (DUF420 family)